MLNTNTISNITLLRNFLITSISLQTFQRASVIASLGEVDLHDTEQVLVEGRSFQRVLIEKHKTTSTVSKSVEFEELYQLKTK